LKEAESQNTELVKQRDVLKNQLVESNDKTEECNMKIEALSQQLTELRSYTVELTDKNHEQNEDLLKKAEKIGELETRLDQSNGERVNNLRDDIRELQIRLKKKTSSYDNLVAENQKSAELSAKELKTLEQQITTEAKKHHKVNCALNSLKGQFEDLSYKYDEHLMISNLKETELRKMDGLKMKNAQLKVRFSSGQNVEKSERNSSFNTNEPSIADDDDDESDVIVSLNRTLHTKCEELEHMVFLYDERELDITEARDSLEGFQNERKSLADTLERRTEQIEELKSELEVMKRELLEANNGQSDKENQVVELRGIIKEQEAEMIKLGEKLQSVQHVQNETHDQAKMEEMLCSLEQMKNELKEVTATKDEYLKQNVELQNLVADMESLNDGILKQNEELQNLNKEKEDIMKGRKEDMKVDDIVKKKTEEIEELRCEVECLQKDLLEAENGQSDKENQVLELRGIIKEQEAEMIKLAEKFKSVQHVEKETLDQAKMEEMVTSLQQMEEELNEVRESKDEIMKKNVELQNLIAGKEDQFRKEKDAFLDEKEEYESKLESLNDDILKQNEELQNLNKEKEDILEGREEDLKVDDIVKKKTEEIEELRCEVESLQKDLLEAENGQSNKENQVAELRGIIKEQEAEMIKLGEKLKSVQHVEKETHDQAKMEEMVTSLQQTEKELNEVRESKDEIMKKNVELQNLIAAKEDQFRKEKDAFLDEKEEYESKLESLNDDILKQNEELQNLNKEKEDILKGREEYVKVDDIVKKKTEEIEELRCEVECLQKDLLEAENGQSDKENQVLELRGIIKEQEAEMIKLAEKLKSVQHVQNETHDQSKVEEMLCSLEQMKNQLHEVTAVKNGILKQNAELQNLIADQEERFRKDKEAFLVDKVEFESQLQSLHQVIEEQNCKLLGGADVIETSRTGTAQMKDLQRQIELFEVDLLEAKNQRIEEEHKAAELREIIKEQEAEMMKLAEKLKSIQLSQNETNSEVKVEEGSPLQQLENELYEVRSARDEILKQNVELQKLLKDKEEEIRKDKEALLDEKEEYESKCELLKREDNEVGELREIIKEQEAEMIKLGAKLKSVHHVKNEAHDQAKVEEIFTLEQLQYELKEVKNEKEEVLTKNVAQEAVILEQQEQLANEKQIFQGEKDEFESRLESARQLHEELKGKLEQADARVVNLRRVIDDQEEDMFTADNEQERFKQQLEQGKCMYKKLQNDLESERHLNAELLAVREETENELESLREKVENGSDERRKNLENESLNHALEVIQSSEEKETEYQAKITYLTQAVETARVTMDLQQTQSEGHIMSKQAELEDLQDHVVRLQDEVQKLRTSIQRQRKQMTEMQEARAVMKERLNSAETASQEKVDSLQNELSKVLAERDCLNAELQERIQSQPLGSEPGKIDTHTCDDELRHTLTDSQAENANLKNTVEQLNEALCASNVELQIQTQTFEAAKEQVKAYEEELFALKDHQEKELVKEIICLKKTINEQQGKKHTEALVEVKQLQDLLADSQSESIKLQDVLRVNSTKLEETIVQLDNAERKLASNEVNFEKIMKRNNELKNIIDELQDEFDEANEKIRQLEAEVNTTEKHTESLVEVKQLQDLLADSQSESIKLQDVLRVHSTKLEETIVQLDNAERKLASNEVNFEKIMKRNNELKNIIDELQGKVNVIKVVHLGKPHLHIYTLVHWYIYTLVHLHIGTFIHWYIYTLVHLHIGTFTHWYIYTLVHLHIDEFDEANEKIRQLEAEVNTTKKHTESLVEAKQLQDLLPDSQSESIKLEEALRVNSTKLEETIVQLDNAERKLASNEVNFEKIMKRNNELKNIIDELQDEFDEANEKIRQLEAQVNTTKKHTEALVEAKQLQDLLPDSQSESIKLEEALRVNSTKLEETTVQLDKAERKLASNEVNFEKIMKRNNELKNIIDELQDEFDEANEKIRQLEAEVVNTTKRKLKEDSAELERVKEIIKTTEHMDRIEALRIEIAGKNMKIQELEYKAFKTEEEMNRLRREVQFGYAKMSKLKHDMRRLRKEAVQEDTIHIKR
ncbi:hypothetical protein QZH41_014294, partial [Actinostola sp. cb2023]